MVRMLLVRMLESVDGVGGLRMKADKNDATHYQEKFDEYWLLEDGVYYLLNDGHWQRARPVLDGMIEL